jgi:hypothetical protein
VAQLNQVTGGGKTSKARADDDHVCHASSQHPVRPRDSGIS